MSAHNVVLKNEDVLPTIDSASRDTVVTIVTAILSCGSFTPRNDDEISLCLALYRHMMTGNGIIQQCNSSQRDVNGEREFSFAIGIIGNDSHGPWRQMNQQARVNAALRGTKHFQKLDAA